MNKRELVLNLLNPEQVPAYTPAAFFLHFDPAYHTGQAAVDKHLEYFHYTGMDFVKIQYERTFPRLLWIQKPQDWAKLPVYKEDFFEEQLEVTAGIVQKARSEALVVMTLYSPFMCAVHTAGWETVDRNMREDPQAFKQGMEIITQSLRIFVRGCMERGVDGFYHSTQGGEANRFGGSPLFDECIKPYDLDLMEEIDRKCIFNILHVCDYEGSYRDLTPFLDYPGKVVNCSLQMVDHRITPAEAARMFGRPYMGGLDRKGVIATGSADEIRRVVNAVLAQAPERFILGADCTVPNGTPWDNLRIAIKTAHES